MRLRTLTDDQYFVDRMRQALGLDPLYDTTAKRSRIEFAAGYALREHYLRLADPNCTRCGGSGYFDGWAEDQRCDCMGLPKVLGSVRLENVVKERLAART